MEKTLEFPDLLRLIEDRSSAFRAAIASAPDLEARVPTCPEWTLFDLAKHIGDGRRAWAATIIAGPTATSKAPSPGPSAPQDREALLTWLTESTRQLLDALREAGPDSGCWVGWGDSQSPRTTGAVARHQVQEFAIHTYDAQLANGTPQPLPVEVAVDGVEEFQFTCCATTSPWPHEPATVDNNTTEGPSWRVHLSAAGAHITRRPTTTDKTQDTPDASVEGPASDLILVYYGRIPLESVKLGGSRQVLDQLVAWEPE